MKEESPKSKVQSPKSGAENDLALIAEVRADRDYWERRLQLQESVHQDLSELLRLHKDQVQRWSEKVNHLEGILDLLEPVVGSRDPVAVKKWIGSKVNGSKVQSPRSKVGEARESLCVAEVTRFGPMVRVRCTNCAEIVAHGTLDPTVDAKEWVKDKWDRHLLSKSPSDNLNLPEQGAGAGAAKVEGRSEKVERESTCWCECQLWKRGVHCGKDTCEAETVHNPNAQVKQPFPNGRFASKEKGGI